MSNETLISPSGDSTIPPERIDVPHLATITRDLMQFITKGAGFWREARMEFEVLMSLRVVFQHKPNEDGPDVENQAVESALEAAVEKLASPLRDAARELFGLTAIGRTSRGKTVRSEHAAKALGMDARTFRRRPRGVDTPESWLEHTVESVATSLLILEEAAIRSGVGPRPRLLYVEDEDAFIQIVREALPDYEVVAATTLGQAMDALVRKGPFALVLVDPNLTDSNDGGGLEVLEYLHDHVADVPRVVVTGSRFTGAITNNLGKRYGVSEILIKGDYTLPDLRSTIDRVVKAHHETDSSSAQEKSA